MSRLRESVEMYTAAYVKVIKCVESCSSLGKSLLCYKWVYAFSFLTTKQYIILCSMRSILRNHRFRRDARTLEDEEEMWFNTDEDDLEDGEAVVPPSDKMKTEEDLMEPISKFMERKKCTYGNAASSSLWCLGAKLCSWRESCYLLPGICHDGG